jgi:hypothetical protein
MFRRISAASAVFAVVAMAFIGPTWDSARAWAGAAGGGTVAADIVGRPASPPGTGRRLRGDLAGADTGRHRRADPVGLDHGRLSWLATGAAPFVPDFSARSIAVGSAPLPAPATAGTPRTSRGPPRS